MFINKSRLSSLVFLTGVVLAAAFATLLDKSDQYSSFQTRENLFVKDTSFIAPLSPRSLTSDDLSAARRAWHYFELNTRETGLVDSVSGFPSTTLWDQGSYIFAIIAANNLGIIDNGTAIGRANKLLSSFRKIELYDETLPNKAYNTETLDKTDYANNSLEVGIGWSALDLARFLLALRALERHAPELSSIIVQMITNWNLEAFANSGELWGMVDNGIDRSIVQEGRLGYEQYGARAVALWGLDVSTAITATRVLSWRKVEGVLIPTDTRTAQTHSAVTPILSEPFLLQALEMGLDHESSIFASQIYLAQLNRFERTTIPTLVSEDHLDRPPNFAYSSVFSNDEAWAVVSETGEQFNQLRSLSTKAVFGWDALYGTSYTNQMRNKLKALPDEGQGWQAGIYEATSEPNSVYSLNTNAVILEAIYYKAFGPILAMTQR